MKKKFDLKPSVVSRTVFLFLLFLGGLVLVGCNAEVEADVDEQKLEELKKQLQVVYTQCSNENISTVMELEQILNSGGNGLSKPCRTAIGQLDFQGIITNFSLKLTFQTPKPKNSRNPMRDGTNDYPWMAINGWDATNKQLSITSGIEIIDWSNVKITGIDSSGGTTQLTDFSFADFTLGDSAISYTTDYSGSMLEDDLLKISDYFTQFYQVLPGAVPGMVQLFSNSVTKKFETFATDSNSVVSALAYDSTYPRSSTALYDAWGSALGELDSQNKKISLNILATDGFENISQTFTRETLSNAINNSNAFNLIICSGWSEPEKISGLVGGKGLVVYTYQIDEAQILANDIKTMLDNIQTVTINENVSNFKELNFSIANVTKLLVTLTP